MDTSTYIKLKRLQVMTELYNSDILNQVPQLKRQSGTSFQVRPYSNAVSRF